MLKPYSNLRSKNLGLFLFLARASVILGLFILVVAIVVAIVGFAGGSLKGIAGLSMLPLSLAMLFLSGVMAALVSFEENYRIRTEILLRKGE